MFDVLNSDTDDALDPATRNVLTFLCGLLVLVLGVFVSETAGLATGIAGIITISSTTRERE